MTEAASDDDRLAACTRPDVLHLPTLVLVYQAVLLLLTSHHRVIQGSPLQPSSPCRSIMPRRRHAWSSYPSPPIRVPVFTGHTVLAFTDWVVIGRPSRAIDDGVEIMLMASVPETVVFLGRVISRLVAQSGWITFQVSGFSHVLNRSHTGNLCVPSQWANNVPPLRLSPLTRWAPAVRRAPEHDSPLHAITTYLTTSPEQPLAASSHRGPSLSFEGWDLDALWNHMRAFHDAAMAANDKRGSA